MINNQETKFIQENLNFLFGLFVVFNQIRKNENIDLDLKKILVSGLARSYIGGLANLVDPAEDKMGNKNLSIYLVTKIDLSKYDSVINKLRNIRNKIIAHNDREAVLKGEDFFNEINFTIPESEALLLQLSMVIGGATGTSMPIDKMREDYVHLLEKILRNNNV